MSWHKVSGLSWHHTHGGGTPTFPSSNCDFANAVTLSNDFQIHVGYGTMNRAIEPIMAGSCEVSHDRNIIYLEEQIGSVAGRIAPRFGCHRHDVEFSFSVFVTLTD